MRFRGLLVIFALALLLAAPAGGHVLGVGSMDDKPGDGSPDITRVRVGSNATAVTFIVDLANKATLIGNEGVFILIDSDLSPETGLNGFEFVLGMVAGRDVVNDPPPVGLLRWNGTEFVAAESQTTYGYHHDGFRLALNRSDLALTTGTLRFMILTSPDASSDFAPDDGFADYTLSNDALTLQIARFKAAKTIVAGKRYTATLQARRSDLAELSSAGDVVCAAKVGTKTVKVTATFPADLATCSGVVPKNAKGKVLKVTVTLTLDGVRVTRTASIKVK